MTDIWSKGQPGIISAFLKGQGVTKKGQGATPCKNGIDRTQFYVLYMKLSARIIRESIALSTLSVLPFVGNRVDGNRVDKLNDLSIIAQIITTFVFLKAICMV